MEVDDLEDEELMRKIDKIQTKLKFTVFGKSKPQTARSKKRQEEAAKENETEDAKELLARQIHRMEEHIQQVIKADKGRVTRIFKMKEIIGGSKKSAPEAQAIKNLETNELVVSNSEIKKVTLKYCLKTLENNPPEKEMRELIEFKEELHRLRLENHSYDKEYMISEEDFFMILMKFKSKRSATYDFIVRAGLKFQLAIFKLCKRLISNETFPTRFNLTTLIQLPKKGSAQELENKRFIHIKDWLARLVEALAVQQMKADIFQAGTKFQIGGCPGMRTVFHLFVLKSNIALKVSSGHGVILTLLDLIKFFDKQSLIDACDALHQANVNSKFFRVWYQLNARTEIEVQTGAGVSARGMAGPVTGQGGGGAALASALNLDLGVHRYFKDSIDEDFYGTIRLQPLSYIDDVSRSSPDTNSVRAGNAKFSSLAAEKQLQFHPKKSCYLVIGTEKYKARVRLDAEEEPIRLGKATLGEKKEEKYLGDMLSSMGLAESAEASVRERVAKTKGSIYELRALIEDFRMQTIGGMEAAIDLYESCIVPSLLSNASTWMEVRKETEEKLDGLQDLLGRVLLQVPQSTPKLETRGALGLLGMKWRVWQAKVLLAVAIREQEEGCLAREVWEEQVRMGWPGLAREVKAICKEIGIADITDSQTRIDKDEIKEAIIINHLKCMKEDMSGKKLDIMKRTDMRQRRQYTKLSVEECRMAFRLEVFQFDCRANMPTRYGRDLRCRACGPEAGQQQEQQGEQQEHHVEDQDHLEVCPGYGELWDGLGPASPESRVRYFMRVKMKRMKQQQK